MTRSQRFYTLSTMNPNILIIDDDRELCSLLEEFLQRDGFNCMSLHDGAEALEHCRTRDHDAVVLDIMLPGLQGLDVLRGLREFSTVPVLMLTARGEDTDRIIGLELGADDYLPKPCNPRELAARLRAILRRTDSSTSANRPLVLSVNNTVVNSADRRASYQGQELDLTGAEFNVLRVLLSHAGKAVDKDTISQQALGRPLSAYDRSVDVHVSKIRKKLAAAGGERLIVSVRNAGYQFLFGHGDG